MPRRPKLKENNKLPGKQSKTLKAKIRRGILILLSSFGIATLVSGIPHREEPKGTKVESNIDERKRAKDKFKEPLKKVPSNEGIIDEIIEKRR